MRTGTGEGEDEGWGSRREPRVRFILKDRLEMRMLGIFQVFLFYFTYFFTFTKLIRQHERNGNDDDHHHHHQQLKGPRTRKRPRQCWHTLALRRPLSTTNVKDNNDKGTKKGSRDVATTSHGPRYVVIVMTLVTANLCSFVQNSRRWVPSSFGCGLSVLTLTITKSAHRLYVHTYTYIVKT